MDAIDEEACAHQRRDSPLRRGGPCGRPKPRNHGFWATSGAAVAAGGPTARAGHRARVGSAEVQPREADAFMTGGSQEPMFIQPK